MSAPIRLVSFDVGGVLLFPNWRRVSAAVARAGISVSADALQRADARARFAMDQPIAAGATNNEGHAAMYFGGLLRLSGVSPDADIAAALGEVREEHASRNLWEYKAADAAAMLERLKSAGFQLVVVSNADGRLQALLERAGLATFFSVVADSQLVGVEKPDPAIFHGVLDAVGVAPGDAVHVGDFYTLDVAGARAAGMTPVLLDPENLQEGRDCARVRDFAELERYLLQLAAQ